MKVEKVSTYFQSHAEIITQIFLNRFVTGWSQVVLYFFLFAKAVDFPTVSVGLYDTANQLRNVSCCYSLLQATAKFPQFQWTTSNF
jgi:ABC-type maltose transport system permease subunit